MCLPRCRTLPEDVFCLACNVGNSFWDGFRNYNKVSENMDQDCSHMWGCRVVLLAKRTHRASLFHCRETVVLFKNRFKNVSGSTNATIFIFHVTPATDNQNDPQGLRLVDRILGPRAAGGLGLLSSGLEHKPESDSNGQPVKTGTHCSHFDKLKQIAGHKADPDTKHLG